MLYLLATPLGNLGDMTVRSLETLRKVERIYAEDTRRSRILLERYDVKKPLFRYDEHRPLSGTSFEAALLEGRDIAFISDAGMPLISDPGFALIAFCLEQGVAFEIQPGPSAVPLALALSGLSSHSFVFGGFLPRRRKERRERLAHYQNYPETLIFYETPHRISEALEDAKEILGDRRAALLREMTKIHEEHLRMSLSALHEELKKRPRKGEMVLVIEGALEVVPEESPEERIDKELKRGIRTKEIAAILTQDYGIKGSQAYRMVLERIEK